MIYLLAKSKMYLMTNQCLYIPTEIIKKPRKKIENRVGYQQFKIRIFTIHTILHK